MIFLLGIITERHARVYGTAVRAIHRVKLRGPIGLRFNGFSNSVANREDERKLLSPFSRQDCSFGGPRKPVPVLSGVIDPAQHSCLYLADAT